VNLKTPRLYAAALLALVTCLVAACASNTPAASTGGSPSAAAPAALKVELDWVPNPDHVGLYYAQNKGMLASNNLTVNFLTPSNAADPIKLVGLNKVDLAISYESEMFYGQQEKLPVTAVATVIPVPLNSLIVTPKDHVTSLSQMAGKKVGITGIPSDGAIYTTMLKAGGLTPSQVTSVTVGFNLVPSILSGKVDGIIGGYRNVEAIQIAQEMGQKPAVFPASALGVPQLRRAGAGRQPEPARFGQGLRGRGAPVRQVAGGRDQRGHQGPVREHPDHGAGVAVQGRVPQGQRALHGEPAEAPGRDEDRLHQRGELAELRQLDEAEQAHQDHAQRLADRHRQVHAVQLQRGRLTSADPGPAPRRARGRQRGSLSRHKVQYLMVGRTDDRGQGRPGIGRCSTGQSRPRPGGGTGARGLPHPKRPRR
jgi:ABC-type phosphate/phosphonate transport system substrate-binding protein